MVIHDQYTDVLPKVIATGSTGSTELQISYTHEASLNRTDT